MRVLVTGGTGFIGRRLVRRLLGRGDDVTLLTRDTAAAGRRATATRFLAWDPIAGPPPVDAASSVDAVVNLLGESIAKGRWTAAKKRRIRESRLLGTRHLVAAISEASSRPSVLVSGSAVGYYGQRGDDPLDERASPGGDFLANVCVEWEAEAARAEGLGLRVVRLRTGIALGADGGALKAMLLPFKLGAGGPAGSGEQWMSWIHADDLCGAIVHALDRPELSGAVNGTSSHPVRNRDFAAALGRALGRPAFLPTPAFALKLLLGEMAEALLLGGQRVVPARLEASGFRFRFPDLGGALADLLRG